MLDALLFVLGGLVVFLIASPWAQEQLRAARAGKKLPISVVERRVLEDEIELELSDGRMFRSNLHGIIWRHFPDGGRVEVFFESWLEEQNERLAALDKWSAS